jgi:hypothetical protein
VIVAHIAGLPVEETLLTFAPVGALGIGAAVSTVRTRLRTRASTRATGTPAAPGDKAKSPGSLRDPS